MKHSWVTRDMPASLAVEWRPVEALTVGDVLLCEVIEPSLHSRLEMATGGRSRLYPGDRIVCALGGRYATSMLEGLPELDGAYADLLSASGVCGRVVERGDQIVRPTRLTVLGQAFHQGRSVNLHDFALVQPTAPKSDPTWVLVVGSAMDSGKTTACAALINGLARAGVRVGAAKLTGTASVRDLHAYRDAGATLHASSTSHTCDITRRTGSN